MDKRMTVIITMAGLGSRFQKAGYSCPKYKILAKGKTLFEWAMDSLVDYNPHVGKYVFVVRREEQSVQFIQEQIAKYDVTDVDIVEIDDLTDGQATTTMLAIPYCDSDAPIIVYNIDTYVEPYAMQFKSIVGDGHIPCFHADGNHWSFAKLDDAGKVIEVREKQRISDNCSLGAYYFSSARLYEELYNEYYIQNSNMESNEKYIAPLYNLMIKKGMDVTISLVDRQRVHVLGTPEELEKFIREG